MSTDVSIHPGSD
jgi:hypothetical protein